jgi:hypothetical protein
MRERRLRACAWVRYTRALFSLERKEWRIMRCGRKINFLSSAHHRRGMGI